MKLMEENVWKTLQDIGTCNNILEKTLKEKATKVKLNKWDYIEFRNF